MGPGRLGLDIWEHFVEFWVAYVVLVFIIGAIVPVVLDSFKRTRKQAELERGETSEVDEQVVELRAAVRLKELWGPTNPMMICPHCQTKGSVRTKLVERKKERHQWWKGNGSVIDGRHINIGDGLVSQGTSHTSTLRYMP